MKNKPHDDDDEDDDANDDNDDEDDDGNDLWSSPLDGELSARLSRVRVFADQTSQTKVGHLIVDYDDYDAEGNNHDLFSNNVFLVTVMTLTIWLSPTRQFLAARSR